MFIYKIFVKIDRFRIIILIYYEIYQFGASVSPRSTAEQEECFGIFHSIDLGRNKDNSNREQSRTNIHIGDDVYS